MNQIHQGLILAQHSKGKHRDNIYSDWRFPLSASQGLIFIRYWPNLFSSENDRYEQARDWIKKQRIHIRWFQTVDSADKKRNRMLLRLVTRAIGIIYQPRNQLNKQNAA